MSEVKTIKEVLIAARWIIANFGWCQGSYAKSKDGTKLWHLDDEALKQASCFCLAGAIQAVDADETLEDEVLKFMDTLTGIDISAIQWNDIKTRTKKQVLALFDKAIAKADQHE